MIIIKILAQINTIKLPKNAKTPNNIKKFLKMAVENENKEGQSKLFIINSKPISLFI